MVDIHRRRGPALFQTVGAQRVLTEESCPALLPSVIVTSFVGVASGLGGLASGEWAYGHVGRLPAIYRRGFPWAFRAAWRCPRYIEGV